MRLLVPPTLSADGPRQRGLARAREVLEQQVALAEQRDEAEPDDEGLAEQHLLDVGHQTVEGLLEGGCLFRGHGHRVVVLSSAASGVIASLALIGSRSMSNFAQTRP